MLQIIGLGVIMSALIYFFISQYKNIKTFILDILSSINLFGRWVRRKDTENKYENIINGAIDLYNSNFEDKILSNCRIKWINKDSTSESYYDTTENKAIVCLKFNKKDHDLNFYNATYSFTKTALLPTTREFIKNESQKAIDLNLTKIFIKDYDRKVLRIFNQNYRSEDQLVKDNFEKFEETVKKGLFTTLLLPELHYLGDNLETTTPSDKIEQEIEDFFDWFYDLATREKEEKSVLNYRSKHIKVGVILVANLDTYSAFGKEAYTKWAEKYATEHYGAVYLLARGKKRNKILKEVVTDLKNNKGFDQINKKVNLLEFDDNGEQTEVSIYCLKPNLSKIQYNAWEKLKSAYKAGKTISVVISEIKDSSIIVNVFGVEFTIPKSKLSSREIPDISKFFDSDQELILNIENLDIESGDVKFNNINTETDPNILIESTLNEEQIRTVEINGIQFDREGKERGLKTYCKSINRKVFIPKRNCSYSRFISLESNYKKGQELEVILKGFSMEFANFIGEIKGLNNPLLEINEYKENSRYNAVVQEITKNYLTTELKPGLECRIYRSELSWDNSINTNYYQIGNKIELILIKNDTKNYRLYGSIKRLAKSDMEIFFNENFSNVLEAMVVSVVEGIGLKFKLEQVDYYGFVYAKELMWGFCSNIEKSFPIDSFIQVKPIDFDYQSNEISYSIKACLKNQFDEALDSLEKGELYNGEILRHFPDLARIELLLNGYIIQGYIHKSEISNIAFIEDEDISNYLPIGESFRFKLKRIDNENKIVELSRKDVLMSGFEEIEWGNTLNVNIVKVDEKKAYFYNDEFEGRITENISDIKVGDNKEVFLINSKGDYSC